MITKKQFLKRQLDLANHDLLRYSANLMADKPKKGHEAQHKEAEAKVELLTRWLLELEPARYNPAKGTIIRYCKSLQDTAEKLQSVIVEDGVITDNDTKARISTCATGVAIAAMRLEEIAHYDYAE